MAEAKSEEAGCIEWKVTDDLLEQFKTAKHKAVFCSPEFRTMDGTIWRIRFYPNGVESPDDCSIYLECVKLNPSKPQIAVNYAWDIIEAEWGYDGSSIFTKDVPTRGLGKTFKTQKLQNFKTFTMNCFVQETMNVQNGNKYFEWKINDHFMQKCNNAKYKKVFCSPNFNAIGAQWYITLCPNGWSTEGTAHIQIDCRAIESKEDEMNVCYYIEIEAMNYCAKEFDGKTIKKGEAIACNKGFAFTELQKLSQIVMYIKVWEKGSLETNEEQLYIYKEKAYESAKTIERLEKEIQSLTEETEINKKKSENEKKLILEDKDGQMCILMLSSKMQIQENESLKQELAKIKAQSVEINAIKSESQIDITMSADGIKKEQEHNERIQVHDDRLRKWKVDTSKIEKELKYLVNDGDDEKETTIDTKQLLTKYMECKSLWEKQELRMEETATHCSQLIKLKKILKQDTTKNNKIVKKTKQNYEDLKLKYSQLKKQRVSLQTEWNSTLNKLNDLIDEENTLNEEESIACNEYNICNLETQSMNTISIKFKVLMKDYRSFDVKNAQNIEEMKMIFDKEWSKCMKSWYKWTCGDIICWFKYLENENALRLSKELHLDVVLDEMKKSKMNGTSLKSMDKTDLKTIGFIVLNDRQQIYRKITELISKYPHHTDDDHKETDDMKGQSAGRNIPKEFLCPLSKRIMKDPVKIFDDHTYEKAEIERYLQQYNKSPITGEQCDDDEHWMMSDRKLKQKIKIFVATNDNVLLEGNESNETNFIK